MGTLEARSGCPRNQVRIREVPVHDRRIGPFSRAGTPVWHPWVVWHPNAGTGAWPSVESRTDKSITTFVRPASGPLHFPVLEPALEGL
jgi:hypothetical protein